MRGTYGMHSYAMHGYGCACSACGPYLGAPETVADAPEVTAQPDATAAPTGAEPARGKGGKGGKGDDGESDVITEYLPLVKTIVEEVSDASRQVEVLDAQIKNTRDLIRRMPWAAGALRLRLRKLQARKRAADRRLAIQREGESSLRTWRALGQVAVVASIGLVLALTVRAVR